MKQEKETTKGEEGFGGVYHPCSNQERAVLGDIIARHSGGGPRVLAHLVRNIYIEKLTYQTNRVETKQTNTEDRKTIIKK